jgi:hypothetical protein
MKTLILVGLHSVALVDDSLKFARCVVNTVFDGESMMTLGDLKSAMARSTHVSLKVNLVAFREFHRDWEPPIWPLIAGLIFIVMMAIGAVIELFS